MKSVLVLYWSRGGHTARIARRICESVGEGGGRAEMMDLNEAVHEGVDWGRYDVIALGAPVLYGTYDKGVFAFVGQHRASLESRPSSFFMMYLHKCPVIVAVARLGTLRKRIAGRASRTRLRSRSHAARRVLPR